MRAVRTAFLTAAVVAMLVAAGCTSRRATPGGVSTSTVVPTTTPITTAPVGPLVGSNAATMPDVIGLNLRIASERFTGVAQGARLFTEKAHGVDAAQAYDPANPIDVGNGVVTTTSPAPGATLHGDNLYLSTGSLRARRVGGRPVGPWYFRHGPLVRSINDQGCWGCHAPEFCRRCHPRYKVGTAGMARPPVTVEIVVRATTASLYPDKRVVVTKVRVSGTDGYAVYLRYTDPASATSLERASTEARLGKAIRAAGLQGVGALTVVWSDADGRVAASDKVRLP